MNKIKDFLGQCFDVKNEKKIFKEVGHTAKPLEARRFFRQ